MEIKTDREIYHDFILNPEDEHDIRKWVRVDDIINRLRPFVEDAKTYKEIDEFITQMYGELSQSNPSKIMGPSPLLKGSDKLSNSDASKVSGMSPLYSSEDDIFAIQYNLDYCMDCKKPSDLISTITRRCIPCQVKFDTWRDTLNIKRWNNDNF